MAASRHALFGGISGLLNSLTGVGLCLPAFIKKVLSIERDTM